MFGSKSHAAMLTNCCTSTPSIQSRYNNSEEGAKMLVGVVTAVALSTAGAQAQQNSPQVVDMGKYYFESHCAICHGLNGTGLPPEPGVSYLTKNIPNLTTLSNGNGGVFPFMRVYETIDGRNEVQAHGPRDMPIWGREFTAQSLELNPYYNPEAFARAKILALTEYIYRLQGK
jgi:mono/diheme cytochrome c family protein